MERRQFTREFKLEAVRLIKQRGVSYAQASKDLGIHLTCLRSFIQWRLEPQRMLRRLARGEQRAIGGAG
ncbi:transposase, partial [Bradyrhizobium sp. 132]|uniref:transposase n=2 Tax=unclassified Bradyrhizobium TaxID=2631580 RepID=UPI001FF8B8C3